MKKPKRFIIPVFIPHEGCRFRCVFCDQHAITGDSTTAVNPGLIRETVYRYRDTNPLWEGERELAFFGGSFTALDTCRQEELLIVGKELIDTGAIHALRVSTRPDAIDETSVDRLVRFGVRMVEIGVQAMDDGVLTRSQRGHTVSDTIRAVRLLRDRGVSWIAQIMPGLPGDTDKTMFRTASRVCDLSPDGVRIYPALVISGTAMERMYQRGEYAPLPLERAVHILKTMVEIFEQRSIPIIRIGLCTSRNLENRIVAGPYHPALGSLVYEARMLDAMIVALEATAVPDEKVTIQVHPHDVSRAVGNRRSSITELKKRFPNRDFDIVGDCSMEQGKVRTNGI